MPTFFFAIINNGDFNVKFFKDKTGREPITNTKHFDIFFPYWKIQKRTIILNAVVISFERDYLLGDILLMLQHIQVGL